MSERLDRRTFLRRAAAGTAALPLLLREMRAAQAASGWSPFALAEVHAGPRIADLLETFDVTEHGHDGWYDVVLHPGDRERLDRIGVAYRILIPDLLDREIRERTAEAEAQHAQPSRQLTYRTLAEYEANLRVLAANHPSRARLSVLPFASHEGRDVYALEIADDIDVAAEDGRPVSAIFGLHHAREWPSGELTIMLAEDLLASLAAGDPRIAQLLAAVRVILVPVVNPDGYVRSRETVSDWVSPAPGVSALTGEFAYHRKNLRRLWGLPFEPQQGVDLNRNYPYRWGGGGSSSQWRSQIYRGPAPGSEPEVANLLWLMRRTPVLTMITNHTYGDLIIRPWGFTMAPTPDDAAQAALASEMAAHNGYTSIKGPELYVTNGITDDWLYGACGGFGYTFEIGSRGPFGLGPVTPLEAAGFHPQYNLHIADFYSKNREAFLTCLAAARRSELHAILEGTAPPGSVLTIRKEVTYSLGTTVQGSGSWTEEMEASIRVPSSGTFTWHVNPSPLPATVAAVGSGQQPSSALEPYEVTAAHPGGSSRTASVVALRGQRHSLDLT